MKKDKTLNTNATRILVKEGIPFDIVTYEFDEEHLDAVHASKSAGLDITSVFKTIVLKGASNNLYVFCLPGKEEISLKKARLITGEKEINLLKTDLLLKYTGYVRGGCSPIGMIKKYKTYISDAAMKKDKIYVSAGKRGEQIEINPEDLIKVTDAEVTEFT